MTLPTTDAEIQQAVLHELEWDSRVDHAEIGVSVRARVVTLTGSVDAWAKRVAAQEAAHRVRGVLDVACDIEVLHDGARARSDAEIARAVRDALEWNVFVPHEQISSTVSEGRVTLEGTVELLRERDEAERAISHLAGVRLVLNDIIVRPPRTLHGESVRAAIQSALERRATRESDRIRVEAHDGIVTLSGAVHTWADKKAVVGAARGTQGVCSVHDELRIEP